MDNDEAQHHLLNTPAGLRVDSRPHMIEPSPASVDQANRPTLFVTDLFARESDKPHIETEVLVGNDTLNPQVRLIAEPILQRVDRLEHVFSATT